MFKLFTMTPVKMRAQMLHEAEIALLEQTRAAEYHQAQAAMLSGRVSKLRAAVAVDKMPLPDIEIHALGGTV